MTTHAMRTSEVAVGSLVTRNLDIVLLALALPIFLVADLPMVGYAGGALAYLLQRLVGDLLARRAARTEDLRTELGLIGGSMVGRGWLAALIIFGAYLIDDEDAGLAAAVLFLMTFTIGFGTTLLTKGMAQAERAAAARSRGKGPR